MIDKRLRLIKLVEEEGKTIKDASDMLEINYSTAKHIVKNYKESGSVQTLSMKRRYHEYSILDQLDKLERIK